jgi:hypothetical protein
MTGREVSHGGTEITEITEIERLLDDSPIRIWTGFTGLTGLGGNQKDLVKWLLDLILARRRRDAEVEQPLDDSPIRVWTGFTGLTGLGGNRNNLVK